MNRIVVFRLQSRLGNFSSLYTTVPGAHEGVIGLIVYGRIEA
jgi:hypothetical protein